MLRIKSCCCCNLLHRGTRVEITWSLRVVFLHCEVRDARKILETFYDRVRDADPEHVEAYIATAELALEKGDYKVAAETLAAAQRFEEADPRIPYLLARAWEFERS